MSTVLEESPRFPWETTWSQCQFNDQVEKRVSRLMTRSLYRLAPLHCDRLRVLSNLSARANRLTMMRFHLVRAVITKSLFLSLALCCNIFSINPRVSDKCFWSKERNFIGWINFIDQVLKVDNKKQPYLKSNYHENDSAVCFHFYDAG